MTSYRIPARWWKCCDSYWDSPTRVPCWLCGNPEPVSTVRPNLTLGPVVSLPVL